VFSPSGGGAGEGGGGGGGGSDGFSPSAPPPPPLRRADLPPPMLYAVYTPPVADADAAAEEERERRARAAFLSRWRGAVARSDDGGGAPAPRAAAKVPPIVILYGAIAAFANTLFGIETSVISISKLYFAPEFGVASTSPAYGAIAAANAIGATFGALLAGWPQDALGRRITLIVACCIYGGAVTVSVTAGSFVQLFVGRLVTGLAIGLFSSTAPMYISELAPPAIRGTLVTVNQVCICSGILLGYGVGKLFGTNWRLMLGSGLPIAAVLLLAFVFVTPFSPRWLVTKGRVDEARAVLLRIRTTHAASDDGAAAAGGREEVEAELAGIELAVAAQKTVSRSAVFAQPWVRWAVVMGVMLSFMQQWTGCNAVNAYAPDVLADAGFSASDSITQSINIGVVKLLFVMVALALMDRLGRRLLLLIGTGGMAISLGCLATALLLHLNPYFTVRARAARVLTLRARGGQ
jgi:sugar porter (SP) family MFS transporter